MNAFLYLVWTSGRNRAIALVRRARSPRQIVALAAGGAYLWWFLFRPIGRAGAGGVRASFWAGQPVEMLVTALLTLTVLNTWVFGSDVLALAFSQAELSMLFPAPVTRRGLIVYKLLRAQVGVLVNALIWVFVLRRGGTALPSPLRALSLWVLFSTLNLHRLGAALIWSAWREHGRAGFRRNRGAIVVCAALVGMLLAGLVAHRAEFAAAGRPGEFFGALGHVLATAPASIALYPMHLMVAPAFASSIGAWARAIPFAVALLLANGLWVMRSDAAFEDAAIEASAERERRRAAGRTRWSAPRAPRASSTIQLAATGHPAMAVLWKNMLCLRRTAQLRLLIGPAAMAIAIGGAASSGGQGPAAAATVGALTLAAMMLVFGGRLIRNDLRHDMLHLPLLKSSPIAPEDIVLAEVASSALPMAAIQMVLLIVAFVGAVMWPAQPLGVSTRIALLVAAPLAVLALNGALLTIQNATAVLFPTWIRLGPVVTSGVEALGQNLLSTIANIIGLALGLIVPALIAWSALGMLGRPSAVTLALLIIVGALALGAETYFVIRYLGSALARAEPLPVE